VNTQIIYYRYFILSNTLIIPVCIIISLFIKETSPTTPKSTTHLIFQPEPGRTNSYLPYSNHVPDFVQSRAELYVEEEDTATIISTSHPVDMINGEHVMVTTSSTRHLSHHESLVDKFKYKRPKRCSSKHIFWICVCITSLLGIIAIVMYFCWPRIPRLVLKSEKAERVGEPADWGPRQQPWLRAAWKLNMTLDNQDNFVPTRVKDIELVLMDRDTHLPFAWSRTGPLYLVPRKETMVSLLFHVDYEPQSVDDPTFKNLYNACGPQMPTETPALNVSLQAGRI
jgi:hypothetical protein